MDFSYLDDWAEEEDVIQEGGEGYRNIWVVAEAEAAALHPASLSAMGQARELADQIGCYVYGLLLGEGTKPLGERLIACGADKVLVADDSALTSYQPEFHVRVLTDLVQEHRPEILLLPATALGNDLAPRLAQSLDTGLVSHCVKLELDMAERLLLGTFPILNGEMFNTVACPVARPQIATLQPGHFRAPYEDTYRSGDVDLVDVDPMDVGGRLTWLDPNLAFELPPLPLGKARIVVSAGRGMGDAEGFALVEELAAALGGVVAGSRGAFDEGWIGEEQIVGVGGQFVAPDLYVACGTSGDIFHYFGLQEAKYVVAINLDWEAPIMKAANMALVGDAKKIIPAMLEALSA